MKTHGLISELTHKTIISREGCFPYGTHKITLETILKAITHAQANDIPIVLIQHVADSSWAWRRFLILRQWGVEIHPQVLALAPNATVVVKHFADAFEQTELNAVFVSAKGRTITLYAA